MLKYIGVAALWLALGLTLLHAYRLSVQFEERSLVQRVDIEIIDSTSHGQLVNREMVSSWLSKAKLRLKGESPSKINLSQIESVIKENGFVGSVTALISMDGVLRIEIGQREPLFRLLVDGYNHYITRDGYIFKAPPTSALYVPLVTGDYAPPFDPEFEGYLSQSRSSMELRYEERYRELERQKYPYYSLEKENREYNKETRKMFISQGILESREHFDRRVEALRELKRERRRRYRYRKQQIELGIARVELQQSSLLNEKKKLQKSYEDFKNLITFVEEIQDDRFWRSEIVQIVASKAHSGALEVDFVPRSGDFIVRLGRLEQIDEKLERFSTFSSEVLQREGWEWFSQVDLRYEKRIICTEKR